MCYQSAMSTAELKEIVANLAKSQAETDRQMKETDRKLKELSELFTGQWGKLVEALVNAGLPSLFRSVGIKVHQVSRRHEVVDDLGRKLAEVDILLHNGGEDVAVEVKTTCRPKDIDEHIERLGVLHESILTYSSGSKKLYGAVAALRYEADADVYAKKKGMYVLESREGLFSVTNGDGFKPNAW